MQTIRRDMSQAKMPGDREVRRVRLPETRTLVVAAAITGGVFAAGLVTFYYLRKRRSEMTAR